MCIHIRKYVFICLYKQAKTLYMYSSTGVHIYVQTCTWWEEWVRESSTEPSFSADIELKNCFLTTSRQANQNSTVIMRTLDTQAGDAIGCNLHHATLHKIVYTEYLKCNPPFVSPATG